MKNSSHCPYIAVVGAVNIDIGGHSFKPLIEKDSNPGKVSYSFGGVGRNIAHNICLLGGNVKFLTAMGDDMYAHQIKDHCDTIGIDLTHSIVVPGENTSTYLFITGPDGDMALAMSDMSITNYITPDFIKERLDVLNNAAAVVFDANLTEETINFIAENCTSPLIVDPVSVSKAYKVKPVLKYLTAFKPNIIEAEYMSGISITDGETMKKAASVITDAGVKHLYITLGDQGTYYKGVDGEFYIPAVKASPINTTGAGDAFCATIVYSFVNDIKPFDAARLGAAASAMAIETNETINKNLSFNAVKERAGI